MGIREGGEIYLFQVGTKIVKGNHRTPEYSAIGSLLAEQRQNRIRVKLSRGKRKIFSLSFQMKKYSLP